jgi:hypothetical protein
VLCRDNHVYGLLRKHTFDAAARGRSGAESVVRQTHRATAILLRPIIANLRSASDAADEEAEQQRQAKEKLENRAAEEQRLRDPFGGASEEDRLKDPVAYSDLRSLPVKIRRLPDGAPDCEEMTADMLRVIAGLAHPDDTAVGGRLKRDNRETLEQMRQANRQAWSTIEHRLAVRDRELRESNG